MAAKRRKSDSSSRPSKKQHQAAKSTENDGSKMPPLPTLYRLCVKDGTEAQQMDNIKQWEEKGALTEIVWPFLMENPTSKLFYHGCHLLVLMISHHFAEGSFGTYSLEFLDDETTTQSVIEKLLYKTDHKDFSLQSRIIHFVIVALSSNNEMLSKTISTALVGVSLMHWMPDRRRELELKRSAGLRRKFAQSKKEDMWMVQSTHLVLDLLEGNSDFGPLVNIQKQNADADEMAMDVPTDVWTFIHRYLELLIDLLSMASSRVFLVPYLDSVHFGIKCRLAVGNQFAVPENLILVQHLLGRINRLLTFPIDESTQRHLSKVAVVSKHHSRATILQKMAHRHHPEELKPVIYAGVGLLCSGHERRSYLERSLIGFSDEKLQKLMYKMCLLPESENNLMKRSFMIQVLSNHLSIPPYPMDQLRSFPLYPTETTLWDHNVIPPSNRELRVSSVLALPKLNAKYLSFQDYLMRNFELVRLESAYEIRSDLVNVVKRVRPLLRQSSLEESEDFQVSTEFAGWSRMSLEIDQPLTIIEVQPPKLGETVSAKVTAEVSIDLQHCGDAIREEWDAIGEYDNLFLVAIDASKMSGKPAPLMKDYHLRHGVHKMWDSDNGEKRVPDDEDSTFCERYGITMVRGCMVRSVRNESGTVLSEPGVEVPEEQRGNTKRIFKIELDSAQYVMDRKSSVGTESYKQFNLVVRRHGRENNFKAVLETIRGLLEGAGSIERVIPQWLQKLVLGTGDTTVASYKSASMKEYAMKTVGVNKPSDFLDFGDTFLSEAHIRESFPGKMIVDGKEETEKASDDKPRCNYSIRVTETDGKTITEAKSEPFPKGITGNPVRFTPLQVEAIHAGLSPGLTMVVGPPGTGKTDVAVQIIASLHHSFPTQRTLIITHSNAALNDIFSKVMARGDVNERYMVRLGAGERDLDLESTHDFTKIGRVAYSIQRRTELLEEVQQLSESLGISGKASRGADGSPSYTCETAEYFYKLQVLRAKKQFDGKVEALLAEKGKDADVSSIFPFSEYLKANGNVSADDAEVHFQRIQSIFEELVEYRPYEVLRSQRQRANYLITKQARIVAMTCTHAAIARSSLIELGFEYDNIVMEESGQMMEIESFIPFLLQRGKSDDSVAGLSRLKRVCMLGDHNQLPPVVKHTAFARYSNLDQSLFTRLIKLGVPYIQLDKQGRARPELMKLYSWRYNNLGNLPHVQNRPEFQSVNAGFVHTMQLINVDDFQGSGESCPTPYFYQNLGEAEYVVALFQYMVLIGYSPEQISILTTYNGQKALISDIVAQRCGDGTPLEGIRPRAISTVDQYQGQQNDIILLSLVRTKTVGHLRDIRRLVVAVSRARLGLYVFCRGDLFSNCHELRKTMEQFEDKPNKLQLVLGETLPSDRTLGDDIPSDKIFEVEDVTHLGSIVHSMQEQTLEGMEDPPSE